MQQWLQYEEKKKKKKRERHLHRLHPSVLVIHSFIIKIRISHPQLPTAFKPVLPSPSTSQMWNEWGTEVTVRGGGKHCNSKYLKGRKGRGEKGRRGGNCRLQLTITVSNSSSFPVTPVNVCVWNAPLLRSV